MSDIFCCIFHIRGSKKSSYIKNKSQNLFILGIHFLYIDIKHIQQMYFMHHLVSSSENSQLKHKTKNSICELNMFSLKKLVQIASVN